jgi:HTH-type transcriptional regulator/antitoxin HigA
MQLKPIKTKADHEEALKEIERLWGAEEGTAEGDRLDIFITLVEAYEEAHFLMDMPDPIEAIKFRLEQQGGDKKTLIGHIGNRTRVYEILRGDRALSLAMIRQLNQRLKIPAEILIRPVRVRKKSRRPDDSFSYAIQLPRFAFSPRPPHPFLMAPLYPVC